MFFAFLSGSELLLVFLAIVILFGATRIPQLGDALGRGIHNFRNALSGGPENKQLPPADEKKPETSTSSASQTKT